jgi:serum/glucocorticoid-regulated kinase 2
MLKLNQLEHTIAEKLIMENLEHPFLLQLKHCFQTPSKIYLVSDFMKGGELFQHLKRMRSFSEEQTKFIAACVAVALSHLHNNNYIYRDLKPENILFDEEGYIKLTDFGLAKFLPNKELATTFCGTALYMAPETVL